MTFFTSDQHFGHFNIIRLCSRPFGTVEEMDEALLSKWNAKVKADDTVYILGDLFFRAAKVEPILKAGKDGRKHRFVALEPANPNYPTITITPGHELLTFGKVTAVIHRL